MITKDFVTLAMAIALVSTTCPPVEEGKSYSIQCSNYRNSDKLIWLLTSDSGSSQELDATCPERNNHACTVSIFNGSLEVTSSKLDNGHNSTLKLNKVTKEHRNWSVQCVAVNSETRSRTNVSTCRLEIFFKPQTPICRAERNGDNRILVTCLTAKVHPGLKCQLAQRETRTSKITNIETGLEYKNEPQYNGYSASSCSVLVQYLPPGSYQYFAVLAPDITTYVRNYSVPVDATRDINISRTSREVEIFLESPACPEAASGEMLVCEARGFKSLNSINVFIGDAEVKEVDSSVENGLNGLVYRSRFQVPAKTKRSDNVLCVANAAENIVTNQTTLEAAITGNNSNNIKLNSGSGNLIISNSRCHLHVAADVSTELTCSLEDAHDLTIEMVCVKEKQTLLNKTLNVRSVNVTIDNSADYDGADCQCIARHVDGWIRQKSFFRIIIVPDSGSFVHIVVSVLVIIAVLLVCLTMLIMYRIKLRQKSNYSKVSYDDQNKENLKIDKTFI
ncbi:unnamed protein product [Lymnaea stagnalis]|uniref:Ig-like domain-containing protein n=1 Tax=Lymnaea stagnalis TaxID=6523 RepID=A0AAV2HM38_LYMST